MKPEKSSILIIDKETMWIKFCLDILEENGFKVYFVSDLKKATILLNSKIGYKLNLILVDAGFIESDKENMKSLVKLVVSRKQPIVLLFATDPSSDNLRFSFQLGVSDCVRKPFNDDSLLVIVNQALARFKLAAAERSTPVSPSSVLIIDDDDDWLTTMVSNLPPLSRVEVASTYQNAIEKMNKNAFSLIVSDLRLNDNDDRDMRGLDLIENIRKQDEQSNTFTPIIVVSAYGTPALIRDSYKKYQISYFFDKKYLSLAKYKESILSALSFVNMNTESKSVK